MTEQEWLTCTDPTPMLEFVRDTATDRKLRLFACGCCRRVWHLLLDERSRNAVEFAEGCKDWPGNNLDRMATRDAAVQAVNDLADRFGGQPGGPLYYASPPLYQQGWMHLKAAESATMAVFGSEQTETAWDAAFCAAEQTAVAARLELECSDQKPQRSKRLWQEERQQEVNILLDIFGNPFRPVAFNPSWFTPTVVALATGIYDDRGFDRIPILTDALQDAGCDNADILKHCQGDGPHVRGCWVLDLLLERG